MRAVSLLGKGWAKGWAIAASQHRSDGLRPEPQASRPCGLTSHIAGALDDLPGLAIGTAAAFTVLLLMRGTL